MKNQPNILFIICDEYRSDCLSILGHPTLETPNLDHIAHKGTTFRNAYSSCPSCIAARASIFTGLNPDHTGYLGYRDCVEWNFPNMLPEVLRNNGYQTHCVGKTHFYPQRKHCGFEGLDSYESQQNHDGLYINDYHDWVVENSKSHIHETSHGLQDNSWNARPSALPEELHNNTWVVTKGIEFIRRRDKTRPYFLNLSFHRPHPPIDPPQVYWDMYMQKELEDVPIGDWAKCHDKPVKDLSAWEGKLSYEKLKRMRLAYYAQIAHIDCQIGKMMRYLEHSNQEPDMIIFTSDHGEMLGDHNMYRKTFAYEGSAGVPLIISTKNGDNGIFRNEPVVLEDIYPTIMKYAGLELPNDIDGIELNPLLKKEGSINRKLIHGEHATCYSATEAMQFIMDGEYKYIWFTTTDKEQLFNIKNDPNECIDLAPTIDNKDTLDRLRNEMIKYLGTRKQDGLSDGKKLLKGECKSYR